MINKANAYSMQFKNTNEERGRGTDTINVGKKTLQQLNKHMGYADCTLRDRDISGSERKQI